jgi:hypothetical protein
MWGAWMSRTSDDHPLLQKLGGVGHHPSNPGGQTRQLNFCFFLINNDLDIGQTHAKNRVELSPSTTSQSKVSMTPIPSLSPPGERVIKSLNWDKSFFLLWQQKKVAKKSLRWRDIR